MGAPQLGGPAKTHSKLANCQGYEHNSRQLNPQIRPFSGHIILDDLLHWKRSRTSRIDNNETKNQHHGK